MGVQYISRSAPKLAGLKVEVFGSVNVIVSVLLVVPLILTV